MLKGIDIKETVDFTFPDDTDNPTIFKLGNIAHASKISLFMGAIDKDGKPIQEKIQEKSIDILRAGLKGIKNFNGQDYEGAAITDDIINSIPFDKVMVLIAKIINFNFVSEQEVKN